MYPLCSYSPIPLVNEYHFVLPNGAPPWCLQVALGITTLLTYVPVPLGAAHQGGAMVLFTLMLSLLYAIKPAPSLGTFR